jgi:multidrug efflux pump subunit AcrA (membrane-fusion protein)
MMVQQCAVIGDTQKEPTCFTCQNTRGRFSDMPAMHGLSAIAVEDSVEALFASHGTASRAIYLATIAITVAALTTAAVTSVDLTIRASATLAPAVERQTLRSLSDGAVERVLVSVGQTVSTGDTLVALTTTAVEQAINAAAAALKAQEHRRMDLSVLLISRFNESSPTQLLLPQSRAISSATYVEWRQGTVQIARAERVRDRAAQLMQRGFAVPAEVEATEFDLARAREERSLALERRRSSWAEELADAEQRIIDLKRDVSALEVTEAARYVTAPVSGTIEEITALTRGSVLRAGDPVATISPGGALIADALVAPRDVAYLRVGMPARLLIEGFDVQEWGGADAVVTSVARDYTLADGHPVFRVRMRPLRAELRRANGSMARLGKGLHCQARFLLGKKRIVDLMRRRTSEWLDPVSSSER